MNGQQSISDHEYRTVLRNDLTSFIERSFLELNPHAKFMTAQYIELLAATLEKCRTGETKRLIVNLPPRTLKSHAASVAFPAWLLGHDPAKQIICASYGQDLSDKHARDCRTFQSQYQQDPMSREGGVIKREWIKYYEPERVPKEFHYLLQSWDTASKSGEMNDYSVCTTWGLDNMNFYLLDVYRKRLTYPELKRAVAERFRKFQPFKLLIEDKASGISLIQESAIHLSREVSFRQLCTVEWVHLFLGDKGTHTRILG